MKREQGNIADIMVTGIFILAMTVLMMSFLEDAGLIQQKMEVNQISRQCILRMETTGYLTEDDQNTYTYELGQMGVTNVDFSGTTVEEVGYGERIVLQLQGLLQGEYPFVEKRVSTAKN